MKHHLLQADPEQEVLWFKRRDTLKAAAAWLALGSLPAAMAQQRSNIVELIGQIHLNGQQLQPEQTVQTGDQIQTAPNSSLIFVVGDAAFQVRQNSVLTLERGHSLTSVSQLRLFKGAVLSVWGTDSSCKIIMPTVSAGFRGAGIYAEASGKNLQRSYLCNCYGKVALSAGKDRTVSTDTHQAFWATSDISEDISLMPADSLNHSDEEVAFLASLLGLKPS